MPSAYDREPPPRDDFILSVVIPVYNERKTIEEVLARVASTPYRKEIIVVDDGSTDGTAERIRELDGADGVSIDQIVLHGKNRGKGAALRSGFERATGDFVLIQDGDLEYDPVDYPRLLAPLVDGRADVVFGSRLLTGSAHRVLFFWHSLANKFLTLISNMVTNLNLTDMETGYKVFRRDVVARLDLRENRFGVEPEMTAKIAKMGCRVYEVGISYAGRSYEEGKKIGWKDAVVALVCVLKYGFVGSPLEASERKPDERKPDERKPDETLRDGDQGLRESD